MAVAAVLDHFTGDYCRTLLVTADKTDHLYQPGYQGVGVE